MRSARTLALLALAATLTACGSGSAQPRPATSQSARAIAPGDSYVAMGDSYTAAPYTGPTAADDGCLQSETNYPHQVAAKLGLKLTDVSCGGATTGSITGTQTTGSTTKPPQIDALSPTTALVTLSIGGNDGGVFGAAISTCLAVASQTAAQTGSTQPCADLDALAHAKGTGTTDRIATMEKSLVKVLGAIRARAPHARVLVVSYPRALPASTCPEFPLATGDVAWATRINEELVAAQRQAARTAGVGFVDVYTPTAGHDICSSDPWEAGEHPTAAAAPFHPYAVEQQAVADAVEQALATATNP